MQSIFNQLFLTIIGVGASLLEKLSGLEVRPLTENEWHDFYRSVGWEE
jgi:hypothetical protein